MHKWNTQVDDDAHDIDVLMPMCNLIEYSDIYSKTSASLCQRWTSVTESITDFPNNDGTKDAETMKQLKYSSNFQGNLKIPLINS